MKLLGIDYGSKKVGIAVSDDGGTLAFPREVMTNDSALLGELKAIVEAENVEAIVFGESLDQNGEENTIMTDIQKFKEVLDRELKLPIFMQKEAFTSVHAQQPVKSEKPKARKTKKAARKDDDQSAAALILQRYLDRKNSSK